VRPDCCSIAAEQEVNPMSEADYRPRRKAAGEPSHAEIVRSIEDGLAALSATMVARFDAGERRMDRIETAIRQSSATTGGHEARIAALEAEGQQPTTPSEAAAPAPWWARWAPYIGAGLAGVGFLALVERGPQLIELIRAIRND
jgi:hypothetical protein